MDKRKTYTAEFKREAVALLERPGASVLKIAKDLGVSSHSLYAWQKAAKAQGSLAFPGHGKVALTPDQEENRRLKKELELVKRHLFYFTICHSATVGASSYFIWFKTTTFILSSMNSQSGISLSAHSLPS
jgi:transposase